MRSLRFFFLVILCLWVGNAPAQGKDSLRMGVELSVADAYTGLSSQLGVFVRSKKNEFALRFKSSLTYLNSGSNFPAGMGLSYRRITASKKHYHTFVESEYENLFFKHYSYLNNEEKLFQAHEVYLGYGMGFRSQHIVVTNTISYGIFGELLMEDDEGELFYHISPKIKLTLAYIF